MTGPCWMLQKERTSVRTLLRGCVPRDLIPLPIKDCLISTAAFFPPSPFPNHPNLGLQWVLEVFLFMNYWNVPPSEEYYWPEISFSNPGFPGSVPRLLPHNSNDTYTHIGYWQLLKLGFWKSILNYFWIYVFVREISASVGRPSLGKVILSVSSGRIEGWPVGGVVLW